MRKIWQADILEYICEYFQNMNQKELERAIREALYDEDVDDDFTPSKINRILRQNATGFEKLDPDLFYDEIIVPQIRGKDKEPEKLERMLQKLKKFLAKREVDVSEIQGDTYEEFVRNMLDLGLERIKFPGNAQEAKKALPHAQKHEQDPKTPQLSFQSFVPEEDKCVGRSDLLEKMETALQNDRIVILKGLGGIGKTFLSEEYAGKHNGEYSIQRKRFDLSLKSFRQMILALDFENLDEQEQSEQERFENRKRLLKRMDGSTLLILDNIDTPWDKLENGSEGVSEFFDFWRETRLRMIVTTRLTDQFNSFPKEAVLEVTPLPEEDQLKLFSKFLHRDIKDGEEDDVLDILRCVEGHTLLIELSARAIDEDEISCKEMLEVLKTGNDDNLSATDFWKDDLWNEKIWQYVCNILFKLDFNEEQNNTLRHLALLPVDGVFRKLFIRLSSREILKDLVRRSWAISDEERKADGKITRLHPIIREVVRKKLGLTYDGCKSFLDSLALELEKKDHNKDEKADLCRLCRNIVDKDAAIDFGAEEATKEKEELLCRMAKFCGQNYQYQSALDIYQCALAMAERIETEASLSEELAKLNIKMGYLHQQLAKNNYEDAIRHFERAAERAPNNLLRAEAYSNLAVVYRKRSDYDDALLCNQEALELLSSNNDGASIENHDYKEALIRNQLGLTYLNMEDCEKAQEQYGQAYKLLKGCFGEDGQPKDGQPEDLKKRLAYVIHNTGTAWHKRKSYDKAKEWHEKALKLREEKSFSEWERDAATSYMWLGNDYMKLGEMDRAKEYLDTAARERKRLMGEGHLEYAWVLQSLSEWYEKSGDVKQAKDHMDKVVAIRLEALGEKHKYTINAIHRRDELCGQLKGDLPKN